MRLAKRLKSADGKNACLRIKEPSTCIIVYEHFRSNISVADVCIQQFIVCFSMFCAFPFTDSGIET